MSEELKLTYHDYNKRLLKILIYSNCGEELTINLPIAVIKSTLIETGRLPLKGDILEGIDIKNTSNKIISAIEDKTLGEIINIVSSKSNRIRIKVE